MRQTLQSLVVAALACAAAAPVPAQRETPWLAIEASYRQALAELAAGALELSVSRVIDLEEESSTRCVRAVELRTAEQLAASDAEALVAQGFLRLAVHQDRFRSWQPTADLLAPESVSINGLRDLVDLYVERSRRDDARSTGAGLLTYLAHVVGATRSAERLDTSRLLLEQALELDPSHRAALHSLAVTLELRGHPVLGLTHLERLLVLEPESPGFRIRSAVLTVKAGRRERGRRLLEDLAVDGPAWTRDLATQELARLLLAADRPDEAERVLRRGLRDLPPEKLSLQLAALLDPRWTDSWQVLATWLAAPGEEAGPSARWIYEDGAKEDVDALRRQLGAAAAERTARLAEAVQLLPGIGDGPPDVRAACR